MHDACNGKFALHAIQATVYTNSARGKDSTTDSDNKGPEAVYFSSKNEGGSDQTLMWEREQ